MPVEPTPEQRADGIIARALEAAAPNTPKGTLLLHWRVQRELTAAIAGLIAERAGLLEQIAVMENWQLNDAIDMSRLMRDRDSARAALDRLRDEAEPFVVSGVRDPAGADICELCEVVAVLDEGEDTFPHALDCPLAPLEEPK